MYSLGKMLTDDVAAGRCVPQMKWLLVAVYLGFVTKFSRAS